MAAVAVHQNHETTMSIPVLVTNYGNRLQPHTRPCARYFVCDHFEDITLKSGGRNALDAVYVAP